MAVEKNVSCLVNFGIGYFRLVGGGRVFEISQDVHLRKNDLNETDRIKVVDKFTTLNGIFL